MTHSATLSPGGPSAYASPRTKADVVSPIYEMTCSIFVMFLGYGAVWAGIYAAHANRTTVYDRNRPPQRRWSATKATLWLIAWVTGGLACVCLGVTMVRCAKGQYVSVPAGASLIDQVILVPAQVGMLDFFIMLFPWAKVRQSLERRSHPEEVDGS